MELDPIEESELYVGVEVVIKVAESFIGLENCLFLEGGSDFLHELLVILVQLQRDIKGTDKYLDWFFIEVGVDEKIPLV